MFFILENNSEEEDKIERIFWSTLNFIAKLFLFLKEKEFSSTLIFLFDICVKLLIQHEGDAI